jgi:iron complex outermembrane receptor protein
MLHQNDWRDLQSSNLQNCFGDVGWRSERAEMHLNVTMAHSVLNGPGTVPVELLAAIHASRSLAPIRSATSAPRSASPALWM